MRGLESCAVTKGVGERIDKDVLQLFEHISRMGNDRIGKRMYVGSSSVGRPWKR